MIAEQGYGSYEHYESAGGGKYLRSNEAHFFPLYPWMIRVMTLLTGKSVFAGILVSNLSAVLFLYFFYNLAQKLLDSERGAQASLFYVFFPTSFYLNAVYSESLFLACLVGAFFYLEQKKLIPALIAAALAMLCRPTAILAVPALIWLAALRFPERRWLAASLVGIICFASLAVYLSILWNTFGNWGALTEGANYWRGAARYPLYALVRFFSNPIALHGQHNSILDFSFAVLHLLSIVFIFRRFPFPYFLYSIIYIVFVLSSSLFSFSRLCLVNFPFFLYLGSQLSGRWAFVVQTFTAMLLAFFFAAFANWFWVG